MVAMLDVVIVIMYLESKQKLHRDISYTNILLREPDNDSKQRKAQKNLMVSMGLQEIEELRVELRCREGLLIDFDYSIALTDLESQMAEPLRMEPESEDWEEEEDNEENNSDEDERQEEADEGQIIKNSDVAPTFRAPNPSGVHTGTAPFIAVELLVHGVAHRVAHDLESVLHVLLFTCSHLQGPCGQVRKPPLYGGADSHNHPSGIKWWLTATNLEVLGHIKFSHMMAHFESHILAHISPYFYPLQPYLSAFRNVLLPKELGKLASDSTAKNAIHSLTTCQDVINVFKNALSDKTLIEQAKQGHSVLGKRSIPGDLVTPNGLDAIKVPKTMLTMLKTS